MNWRSGVVMRRLVPIFVVLLPARLAGAVTTAVLESHIGTRTGGVEQSIAELIKGAQVADTIPGPELARRIEQRLSRSVGEANDGQGDALEHSVDSGVESYVDGKWNEALSLLRRSSDALLDHPILLVTRRTAREKLYKALVLTAHIYMRLGDSMSATATMAEVMRTFRDRSPREFGPEVAQLAQLVKADLANAGTGSLRILVEPDASIYLNEHLVGVGPQTIPNLPRGTYRVLSQRKSSYGRVHPVTLDGPSAEVRIDFGFDAALRTDEFVGFVFEDARAERAARANVGKLAQALGVDQVVLLGQRTLGGSHGVVGRVIDASGRLVRAAGVTGVRPQSVQALGRYLIRGETVDGLVLIRDEGDDDANPAASDSDRFGDAGVQRASSRKTWALITGGVGVASLAVGTIFALEAKSTWDDAQQKCPGNLCMNPADVHLGSDAQSSANVATAGFIVGGAAIVTAAMLWWTAPSDNRATARITPAIGPGVAALSIQGAF